jgi:N-dimethylarginine dimethylaminohydrolase
LTVTTQSETGAIRRLLLKSVEAAFRTQAEIDAQWLALNYVGRPDYGRAVEEYAALVDLLSRPGMEIEFLPPSEHTGMDSIFVRDASIVSDGGVILCGMGKPARRGEPGACRAVYEAMGLPVRGTITSPGHVEGGDVAWLDEHTLAVGRGYRTNDAGIAQLRRLLPEAVEVVVVPLPHWQGPADVFHLMSFLSPIDRDLLLVYSPLLPVPFREFLLERGFALVEVPPEEFDSMGCNVLALAPRRCLALHGNPLTRARLEAAGVEVITYRGEEISRKGGGGPTCITRPIERDR